MGSGLRNEWGVDDPAQAGSDEQAQNFKAAFEAQIGKINGDLQYLAVNAEAAKSTPLAGKRDSLYPAYQAANSQIDPANPSKAQGAINGVLASARGLAGGTAAAKAAAQQALEAWQSREGAYDQAVTQIEELEAFEDPKAAELRSQTNAVRSGADAKRYEEASRQLDALLPAIQPVYEEYLRQKDAKAPCEEQLEAQTARLEPLKSAERPSEPMTAKAGEADTALGEARGKAEARDWVSGLEQMQMVTAAIDELEQLTNDPEREKFLADIGGLDAIVTAPEGTAFQSQQEDWNAITALKDQVAPAGDSGDYAGANTMMADLRERVEAFKTKHDELEQQKQQFEQAQSEVKPRVEAAQSAQPTYTKLQPQLDELGALQGQMDAAAQSEDYEQGLAAAEEMSSKLDTLEQDRQTLDELRQRYESALAELQPRLDALATSDQAYAKLEPMVQELAQARSTMEASAQAGDYEQASTQLDDVRTKVEAIEESKEAIDEAKEAYEQGLAELQPRLDAAAKCEGGQYATLQTQVTAIDAARTDMEAAAKEGDYERAKDMQGDLETKLDDLESAREEIDEKKEDFEKALTELQPRLDKVKETQGLGKARTAVDTAKSEVDKAAAAQDYVSGMTCIDTLTEKLDEFDEAVEDLDAKKKEYETLLTTLQPRLAKAAAAKVKDELKKDQESITADGKSMESSALGGDYDDALTTAKDLSTRLDAFEKASDDSPSVSLGGELTIAEYEFPAVKLSYVKAVAKISGSVKYGPAADAKPPADVKKEDVEQSVLSKAKEVLSKGKWEPSASVKYNPAKKDISLAVNMTFSCEWGPFKGEFAPVEFTLIGFDEEKGLKGPSVSVVNLSISYHNDMMKLKPAGVDIDYSFAGNFGVDLSPDYAAITKWILENVAKEVLKGLAVDMAAVASAAGAVALPAAAAVAMAAGMIQEARNMEADRIAINTALPARKKAEQVAKSYASVLCGGKSGGSDEGATAALAQLQKIMDDTGASKETVQEAIRNAQGGYDAVRVKELKRIKETMYAQACSNFDEAQKPKFGWLEERGPDWGFRGSYRKTLRIVLFGGE